jgi:hypothetical protein
MRVCYCCLWRVSKEWERKGKARRAEEGRGGKGNEEREEMKRNKNESAFE